mgnify:CR=1 FL=1
MDIDFLCNHDDADDDEYVHVDIHREGYWALVLMMRNVIQRGEFSVHGHGHFFMIMLISAMIFGDTDTYMDMVSISMNKHISKPETIYTEMKHSHMKFN